MSEEQTIAALDPTSFLEDGAFAHLSAEDKGSLLELLARVSEQAYRRGAQQGAHLRSAQPSWLTPSDLGQWRYEISLAWSPWLDSARREAAVDRLRCENERRLQRIGLLP